VEMGVLPGLAAQALAEPAQAAGSGSAALFLAFHRAAVMATGYVANGLYSLAALLLVWSTRLAYPRWVVGAGLVVAGSGLLLSATALADSVRGMVWAHVVLIPSLLLWQVGVALRATRRSHELTAALQ